MAHLMVRLKAEDKALFHKACQEKGISMSDRVRKVIRSDIEEDLRKQEALRLVEELGAEKILAAVKNPAH